MDSNEGNQEAIDVDGSMHVFEAERGDDMYTSGASDGASELSRPVSENDRDSEEEYSHSSSSEQEEEPMSCTSNMESIPESSFEPLYNGSTVTVCGAYFCIMKYAKIAKLPYKAIEELLNLLQVICPSSNKLPKSLHQLKKFFHKFTAPYTCSKVCSECSSPCHGTANCENCSSEYGNMIHISIAKSLQTIVSREST